jgi:hypothetical protein
MCKVSKRYCTRGSLCTQYPILGGPAKLRSSSESDLCDRCLQEHARSVRTSRGAEWQDEVLDAIEAVWAEKDATKSTNKASLWDLFDLDRYNGGEGKRHDRGECLSRLNCSTLTKLRGWLETNEEEAVERHGRNAFVGLRADVGLHAWLCTWPSDKPLLPDKQDATPPFDAVGYKRSSRAVDVTIPIRLALLRDERGYKSERDLSKELGVPRTTLRDIMKRMDEIGFSLEKFTTEDLNYITRGPKHES